MSEASDLHDALVIALQTADLSFWEQAQCGWWMTAYEVTGDADYLVHVQSLVQVNQRATVVDQVIYDTVESEEIEHTGVAGVLDEIGGALGSFWKNLLAVFKNLPLILIVLVFGAVAFFLYLRFARKK